MNVSFIDCVHPNNDPLYLQSFIITALNKKEKSYK